MTYSEKLKDPRWQKKRLEILKRDKWACQLCGCKERTLHVHHKQYSGNPWDSRLEDLITYCSICHDVVEFCKEEKIDIPFKILVFENPEIIVGLKKGKTINHIMLFDTYDGQIMFRTVLAIDWLKQILKAFK